MWIDFQRMGLACGCSVAQTSSPLFAGHTGDGLEQSIAHQLTGLLAVRSLSHGSTRHQSSEGCLDIVLSLLLGTHECHTGTQ
jgi:hypothetical protein